MEIPEGKEIECLLDTLKEHFPSRRHRRDQGGATGQVQAQLEEQVGRRSTII